MAYNAWLNQCLEYGCLDNSPPFVILRGVVDVPDEVGRLMATITLFPRAVITNTTDDVVESNLGNNVSRAAAH
jgi:hypothetical protein